MATAPSFRELKNEVREHWNAEPCGSRYLCQAEDFEGHSEQRYLLEPHIHDFAQFSSARGLRVLEVGVGMGADYLQWVKAGAVASGIDLSHFSLAQAQMRCRLAGFEPDLRVADAENLPFASNTFDILYSYGVMHHSPDTKKCIKEAMRVLKPGGTLKIMLYHHASLTGMMLWLRYGALRGKSLRRTVYDHLESAGTKTYTHREALRMLEGFESIQMTQVLSPGDLLVNKPSQRFQSRFYRAIWKFYPRPLIRRFGQRLGLFLLISARKPTIPASR